MIKKNSRDLIGYGAKGKKISWPNNAKLALQIVLNYEEGGENSVVNGDKYALNRSDLNWIDALIKNRECRYEANTSSAGKSCIEEMLSSGAISLTEGKD